MDLLDMMYESGKGTRTEIQALADAVMKLQDRVAELEKPMPELTIGTDAPAFTIIDDPVPDMHGMSMSMAQAKSRERRHFDNALGRACCGAVPDTADLEVLSIEARRELLRVYAAARRERGMLNRPFADAASFMIPPDLESEKLRFEAAREAGRAAAMKQGFRDGAAQALNAARAINSARSRHRSAVAPMIDVMRRHIVTNYDASVRSAGLADDVPADVAQTRLEIRLEKIVELLGECQDLHAEVFPTPRPGEGKPSSLLLADALAFVNRVQNRLEKL